MHTHSQKFSAAVILGALTSLAAAQSLPPGARVQKNLTYATQDGKPLQLDLYLPPNSGESPTPVIIRFSPSRESPSGAAPDLLAKNFALAYAAYLPEDAAAAPNRAFSQFPKNLFAAKAAVRYLRGNAATFHLDKSRIAAWGDGHGASIAALLAMTPYQKNLTGALGDQQTESSAVSAVCLFEGITDWRNAELYGDETVNIPGSPAYQLFGGNPKEHPDDARAASAVNYITPQCPPTLMVTLAGDQQRAMHRIFAQTLRSAGVRSALYEQSSSLAGRTVDEPATSKTVLAFFTDVLSASHARSPAAPPDAATLNHDIDQLADGGLYAQARRLINEQIEHLADANQRSERTLWLKKLRALSDQ